VFRRLLAKKKDVFFRDMALLAGKGAEIVAALRTMFDDFPHVEERIARIKAIEDEADAIAHETISRLHRTFITPIDRNEINRIFKRLDDIVDMVEGAAQRVYIYELRATRREVEQLLNILEKQMALLQEAIGRLSDLRHAEPIRAILVQLHTLENQADDVLRASIGALFREEEDPKTLLKWKEVIEHLEDATDRCEDVADLFENILLEYA
jgi:predicted phosphate transport protein (TIGR00153 family)